MEDLVDDRFGISFQFGIHGAALLRLGGFLQILSSIVTTRSIDYPYH